MSVPVGGSKVRASSNFSTLRFKLAAQLIENELRVERAAESKS